MGWTLAIAKDMNIKTVDLRFRQSMMTYKEWVPPELQPIIQEFHKRPQLWFVGQLIRFLLRPNGDLSKGYQDLKQRLFQGKIPRPLLGIHARGDDSHTEREIVYLDYFMQHIPQGYSTIYLATDDEKNLIIAKQHTNFTWIRNTNEVITLRERYKDGALEKLVYDIFLLSECDHFIGSDASQISRAVYELMQTRHVDASDRGWSINTIKKDKRYWFWWFFI